MVCSSPISPLDSFPTTTSTTQQLVAASVGVGVHEASCLWVDGRGVVVRKTAYILGVFSQLLAGCARDLRARV